MAKPRTITAIDIGTSSIKAMQARERAGGEEIEVIAAVRLPSDGVRKGVVENVRKVSEKIALALEELHSMSSQEVRGVFTNIGGGHMFVVRSRGEIAVSRADHEISQQDVERVLQVAETFPLPPNREILETWPQGYIVDQEGDIKEPVGMKGMRLGVEILALCGFSPYVKNVEDAIVQAGVSVFDVIPSPLAAARAVLTQKQKELGCALLDIGARTCDLAVFEEGELVHAVVFPVGAANITDDIAVGLQVSPDDAEQIKLQFGMPKQAIGKQRSPALKKRRKTAGAQHRLEEMATVTDESLHVSRRVLEKIVRARVCDIFEEVSKELKTLPSKGKLPGGLVLCGGGALLPNIVEFTKRQFHLPCSIGIPRGIIGVEQDPSLAVVSGLLLEGFSTAKERGFSRDQRGSLWQKIKGALGALVP